MALIICIKTFFFNASTGIISHFIDKNDAKNSGRKIFLAVFLNSILCLNEVILTCARYVQPSEVGCECT